MKQKAKNKITKYWEFEKIFHSPPPVPLFQVFNLSKNHIIFKNLKLTIHFL